MLLALFAISIFLRTRIERNTVKSATKQCSQWIGFRRQGPRNSARDKLLVFPPRLSSLPPPSLVLHLSHGGRFRVSADTPSSSAVALLTISLPALDSSLPSSLFQSSLVRIIVYAVHIGLRSLGTPSQLRLISEGLDHLTESSVIDLTVSS